MYDELVKRLREADISHPPVYLFGRAADAIEELSLTAESYKRSMEAWADEAANAQPRWISVTERLPEEKTYVLILFDTIAGKMQGVCFLYKDDDGHNCWTWLDRLGKNLFDIQPTHWMPLPSTDGLNET